MPTGRSSETSIPANTTDSTSTSAKTVTGVPATTGSARTSNKIHTRAATAAAAAAASKISLQQARDEAEMQAHRSVAGTTAPLDPRTEVSNATAAAASTAASTMALVQKTKRLDTNTKDIGASRIAPYAPSEGMGSHRTAASRSARSSKRMMLEARRELQLRELEEARAALETACANKALAKIDLELLQSQSEEEIDEELERDKSTNVERWVEQTTVIADETKQDTKISETKELVDAIISVVKATQPTAIHAPWKYADLPNFNGAYEDWLAFKRSFQDTSAQFTAVHNMARLRKAIQGSAKEAVRSLLFVASDPEEIMKALERRFGRPEQLVLGELDKIKELHPLGDSPNDICTFSSKISNAVTTIQALNQPQYLYSPEVSQLIIAKLSPIMRHGWIHFDARSDDEPILVKIKKFLETEAELCGKFALPELNAKKKSSRYPVHATSEKEENVNANSSAKKHCMQCEENHWITECPKFCEASTDKRWETVKEKRLCFLCLRPRHTKRSCKRPPCKKCKRPHHMMLHSDAKSQTTAPVQSEKPKVTSCHQTIEDDSTDELKPVYAATDGKKVYLKMIPVEVYGPKGSARVLALLDEGSTISMLDANVAAKIGATGRQDPLTIRTVGGNLIEKKDSQRVDMKIKGVHRNDKRILKGVRTVENIKLTSQRVNKETLEKYKHLKGIMKELSYEQDKPALLIGQDNWELIISRKIRKGKQNEPVASLTSLGWVLHGYCSGSTSPVNFVNHCSTASDEEIIGDLIKQHFELESIGIQPRRPSNDADERALTILEKTTKRQPDGRFESGLLWKSDTLKLPNNYAQAHKRLKGIEQKINKDPKMKEDFTKPMENLLKNGYAEVAPASSISGRTFYLPHFAVMHPTKKKIRIVFDAAARFGGQSLNDVLLPGPDLLQSLFGVLLRFRQGSVVADIKEMFLQIRIREKDRDSLRFLWRGDNHHEKPTEYRMTSVIFGAASSPATAIFVKNLNAKEHEQKYPEAARAIVKNHYMDDYLQSFTSIEEAARTAEEVTMIHKAAGFELRQWSSNEEGALRRATKTLDSPKEVRLGNVEEKALGVRWLAAEDSLVFNVGLRNTPSDIINGDRSPTKREVTSAIMSTFDPMGLVAPVLVKGKRLLQDIWRMGTKWDENITEEANHIWKEYINDVMTLKVLKVPRCISPLSKTGQLHTFVDASETAYATAVYWRTTTANGEVQVSLVAGKARVTTIKSVSIPRLELQAALLGARLADTITREMDLEKDWKTEKVYWSDSSTVLQWIKSDPRRFKAFVAHRLAEIEDLTKPHEWRWVPTKENPADDATRQMPRDFNNESRWFRGPAFLRLSESDWPKKQVGKVEPTGEERRQELVAAVTSNQGWSLPDPQRFSSWTRLLRATARIFGFLLQLKKEPREQTNAAKDETWRPYQKKKKKAVLLRPQKKEEKKLIPIPEKHLQKAERALIKRAQYDSFGEDIERIKKNLPLEKSSKLKKCDVLLDDLGILRLNSRIGKIQNIGSREKKLAVLDGRNRIAQLLIDHYHRHFCHGNHATVINELRQKYWILSLRNSVKKILHQCQWCRVRKTKTPTGDLPAERLQHTTHPFTCTAVDYFGPMHVTVGRRKEKRWGVLFTCLTTRAVHLELASSLSTSSMIMALRRMAARRGGPRIVYSDNGTNFVGADHELRLETQKIRNQEVIEAAEREGIQWKFVPPGAPHMAGSWERMVRTVKVALSAVLNERSPPEELLHTLLTEVEHTVNSRPLTHLSADPEDEESLTPNHFLIGRSCGSAILGDFSDVDLIGKTNWKTVQRLADHFWRRWLREYLPTLMPRKIDGRDTTDPKRGDIVIVADSSLPRNTWPRGEVVETYVGPDGRTRVVDIRTSAGVLKRPTSRLIRIVPASSRQEERVHAEARTGGETVSDEKDRHI